MPRIVPCVIAALTLALSACTNPYDPVQRGLGGAFYVLIGTVEQIVDDLRARRHRWGISYCVVHEPYMDAFAPVIARLAGK